VQTSSPQREKREAIGKKMVPFFCKQEKWTEIRARESLYQRKGGDKLTCANLVKGVTILGAKRGTANVLYKGSGNIEILGPESLQRNRGALGG